MLCPNPPKLAISYLVLTYAIVSLMTAVKGPEFQWDNGSTTVFSSRERPQMLLGPTGEPAYLSNGMVSTSWAGNTFTLVAPINTAATVAAASAVVGAAAALQSELTNASRNTTQPGEAPFECSTEWDCTLSGECVRGRCVCDKPWYGDKCQSLKLKPAKLAAPFVPKKTPNHITWGCAPFLANDGTGRVCMYFTWLVGWDDGNHTRPVPASDLLSGSLGMACAASVEGPYSIIEPVAFPFRPGQFDNSYLENAVLTYSSFDEGYLLAYTTSPPGIARNTLNWEGNGGNITGLQDIGIAFSKDPLKGEWKRLNRTILKPHTDGYEGGIAINPAVLTFPNGTVVVTFRGTHDDGYGNCVMENWEAPCVRPPKNLFNSDARWVGTEDPFSYRGPRGYIMISHSFKNQYHAAAGTKAISRDGLNWVWAGTEAYNYTLTLENGSATTFFRREEPKLLMSNDGKPLALFNVVDDSFLYNNTRIIVQELDYS